MQSLSSSSPSAAGSTLAGAATSEPTLRVMRAKPLVVVGAGFEAGETVRVVALGHGGKRAKTVVAGPRGRFKVALPARKTIGCAPTIVTATGSKGSEARLHGSPRLRDDPTAARLASPVRFPGAAGTVP